MTHINRRSAGDTLAIMNEVGLTMPQFVTLHVLVHGGPRTVGAIAGCLRLSAAATSHLVDRLVRAHLVERAEHADDRRQKWVAITRSGRSLVDRVTAERAREFSRVLGRLSPALRRRFVEVLGRVNEELERS